jgi:hypothetical protein
MMITLFLLLGLVADEAKPIVKLDKADMQALRAIEAEKEVLFMQDQRLDAEKSEIINRNCKAAGVPDDKIATECVINKADGVVTWRKKPEEKK